MNATVDKVQTRLEVLKEQLNEQTRLNQNSCTKQQELVAVIRLEYKKLAGPQKHQEKEAEWEKYEQTLDIEEFAEKVIDDLLKECNEQITALNENVKQIEYERAATEKQLQTAKNRAQELEDEVSSLSSNVDKLQAESADLTERFNGRTCDKDHLREEIDEKCVQLKETCRKYDETVIENERLKRWIVDLNGKLAQQQTAAEQETKQLEERIEKKNIHIAGLVKEQEKTLYNLKASKDEIKILIDRINTLGSKLEHRNVELDIRTTEVEELRKQKAEEDQNKFSYQGLRRTLHKEFSEIGLDKTFGRERVKSFGEYRANWGELSYESLRRESFNPPHLSDSENRNEESMTNGSNTQQDRSRMYSNNRQQSDGDGGRKEPRDIEVLVEKANTTIPEFKENSDASTKMRTIELDRYLMGCEVMNKGTRKGEEDDVLTCMKMRLTEDAYDLINSHHVQATQRFNKWRIQEGQFLRRMHVGP